MNAQRKKRRDQMRRLMKLYAQRDCTRREFCDRHHISLSSFSWWHKRLRKDSSPDSFVRVVAAGDDQVSGFSFPATGEHASVEISYPDGKRIKFSGAFSFEQMRSLL